MINSIPSTDILVRPDHAPPDLSADLNADFRDLGAVLALPASLLWRQGTHVIFAVPGAFTPHATHQQVPDYAHHAQEFAAAGVDGLWCLTPNDPFVTQRWWDEMGVGERLAWACDSNSAMARALNLQVCLYDLCMGTRPRPYALLVQQGKIIHEAVDAPGQSLVTCASYMLGVARAYLI